MKIGKKLVYLFLGIVLLLVSSCENQENKTVLQNNLQKVETTKKESEKNVSNNEVIDKSYLRKKYPKKTILIWVYPEEMNMSDEDRRDYEQPLGMRCVTNEQVVKLNDYLASQGKDYVICFQKLSGGDDFAKEVVEMINKNEAPDFIHAGSYVDEYGKQFFTSLACDLVGKGLLEELSQYQKNELKSFFKTLPQKAIYLSEINGNFYGYNRAINEIEIERKWFVNEDLAKEYDVDLTKLQTGGYAEWMQACKTVYEGEKKKDSENFLIYDAPFIESVPYNRIAGYYDKMDRFVDVNSFPFCVSLDGNAIENYYKSEGIKTAFKEFRECKEQGFFDYINENKNDNSHNANRFIDNFDTSNVVTKATKQSIKRELSVSAPRMKRIKEYSWGKVYVDSQTLISEYTVNGVCSKSKNKKLALEAYNFINSDREASNIIKFPEYDGSGKNYCINSSEYWDFFSNDENRSVYTGKGLAFVNPFVANPFSEENSIEEMKENIENLHFNKKYIGNYYDLTPVKKEINAIRNIEKKYIGENNNGIFLKGDFETTWDTFLKELDKAGIRKVLDYLNNQ